MNQRPRGIVLLTLTLLLAAGTIAASPAVRYRLAMPDPSSHLFHVTMTVEGLGPGAGIDVALPVWRTGRYVIFDFAGGVQEFSAEDGAGRPVAWHKTDKSTWHIERRGARTVVVRYKVYANEFDQRTRGLDDEHGFVDGTSVFMYLPAFRQAPVRLTVDPYPGWHVTTGLDSIPGSGTEFTAPAYDHLADCPIEMGTQRDYAFTAGEKPHVLSLSGPIACDVDSLIGLIRRIVAINKEFWGDLPYRRYVFLFEAFPNAGGATEHINSAIFTISPRYSRRPLPCRELAGLISHEFFHTWNVKQIRPRGMDPYDWSRENYYNEIWIAEGSTSYMHSLLLARGGLTPTAAYLNGVAGMVQSDRQRPGNAVQTLAQCSFDLWIKSSRGLQQSYNAESDVYGRGAAVSMVLDLELRHRSGNAHSFDDLLRTLYKRFPLGSGGYTVADVQRIADELAGSSMRDFFNAYVYGTERLPWERALGYAGLALSVTDSSTPAWLGMQTSERDGKAVAWSVVAGSPASAAGLSPGDEVVALDGYRVTSAQFHSRISALSPGDSIRLTVFRRDRLREFTLRLAQQPVPRYAVVRAGGTTPAQDALYSSWLAIQQQTEQR